MNQAFFDCAGFYLSDCQKVEDLAKQGINAEEVYTNALNLYVHSNDKTVALNEFTKGEFVVVIEGNTKEEIVDEELEMELLTKKKEDE